MPALRVARGRRTRAEWPASGRAARDLQPAPVNQLDRVVERLRAFAGPFERDEDAVDPLGRLRVGWDDGDRLWDARDDLERGVSGGLGASVHSARAEDERGDVWVLAGVHDLFDRGAADLAQLDAGSACELGRGT